MPLPIIEQVRRNVVDSCKQVRRANGYTIDLKVEDDAKVITNPVAGLCTVNQRTPAPVDQLLTGKDDYDVDFDIDVFVAESDDNPPVLDERLSTIAADVVKAVMADYRRGGFAINTTIGGMSRLQVESGGLAAMRCTFSVLFRTAKDNPFAM